MSRFILQVLRIQSLKAMADGTQVLCKLGGGSIRQIIVLLLALRRQRQQLPGHSLRRETPC